MSHFHRNEFVVMAIGNIIGSGIFLASAVVLETAAGLAPLAYLFGGLIMTMEVAFLIELAIANPVSGSFKACAQDVFGPAWGFVNGWMFWVSGVLGMASEVIACSILMRLWFPVIPLWLFSLVFAVLITLVNLNDLQGLSKIEFVLASIKFITLVFIHWAASY
jgi:GABA permease/S-methylmethionine transporter